METPSVHSNGRSVASATISTWFDALTKRFAAGPVSRSASNAEPARKIAPKLDLVDLNGARSTLASLLAPGRPLLLAFTDPRCHPCQTLLPDIGGWQRVYGDRLTIALISTGDPQTNRLMTAGYGIDRVLVQQEHEVIDAYGLAQAPAAVLVRPDGKISSEIAYGVNAIRRLVADTLGLVVPSAPASTIQPAERGQAGPPLRGIGLEGELVDLARFRGVPVVLLFWSPACTHCQDLLPGIRAVERTANRPGLIVISRGAPNLNRGIGLQSPVLLDDSHAIADAFGVGGTPAAVVIDSEGIIVSEVLRGSGQVGALLNRIQGSAQTPAA